MNFRQRSKKMTVTGRKLAKRQSPYGPLALLLVLSVGQYVAYFGFMDWVPMVDSVRQAGFGQGFLNGYFAVLTLLVSLFNDTWVVYAPLNSGNGYAAGFLFGLILSFAGARRIKSKR